MPRYIDADRLFEFIQKEKAWKQDTMRLPRYGQGKYDAYYEMLEIIQQQPTAAVEPVVHCGECKARGHCYTEDVFKLARLSDNKRFCGVGERKDGTE